MLNSLSPIVTIILIPLALVTFCSRLRADSSFDLVGPKMEMTVNRGGKVLPISSVSDLQAGDRLWVQADFPANQSVHYVLIVAFLQGPTNPPPEKWFTRIETWNKEPRQEGSMITVPKGAQQALMFLAPETGGDFSTLRSAVRGKPGMFVRASQDLEQASLDRTRVDKYLEEVRTTSVDDPTALEARTKLLAQSLHLKVNEDCFDRPTDQQASCLTQNTDSLVLNDAHSQSMVAALTSGPQADLIGSMTATPVVEAQYYSAYVGSVMDLARLLSTLHTAQYQYIPTLVLPNQDEMNLRLNTPPSFQNPKSVLVIGLPAVESPQMPPLRPTDPKQVFCLQKSPLVLPVTGAPLVFSTGMAHDFTLRLQSKSGAPIILPATADAASGGFVIDTANLKPDQLAAATGGSTQGSIQGAIRGSIQGWWGFASYEGPSFEFRNGLVGNWTIAPADAEALVVGRDDTIHAKDGCAACVEKVTATDTAGKSLTVTWKQVDPNQIEITVPLKDEQPAAITLRVQEYGSANPVVLTAHSYAEVAHLDAFAINAGDREGLLTGARLDEVGSVQLHGVRFVPAKLSRANQEDTLDVDAPTGASVAALQADEKEQAQVTLKDGRVLNLQATVKPPRPKVTLVSKTVQPGAAPSAIHLGDADVLPLDAKLSFFVKSDVPDTFPRSEKIEVATKDRSFHTTLSVADGDLVLQDTASVLAVFDPQKAFGASAFGPLEFRAIGDDGSEGDWQPLANLVRLPALSEVHCPAAPDQQCTLSGTNLFLLDSIASDQDFKSAVTVPAGFMSSTLSVPRPNGTLLYVKLRDDPTTVDAVALPVLPDEASQ